MTEVQAARSGRPVPRTELARGYSIARIINGCWQLSAGHGGNHTSAAQLMNRFAGLLDAGFTTFDCADIYTGVETLLGRFIRQSGCQEEIQVHTKYVPDLASLPSLGRRDVESVIHRSLRRLGLERLDLVQFHWWDYSIPGYLEALGTLDSLRESGKIRLLGLTNFDCRRVAEIAATGIEISSIQLQYSLLDRRPERGMSEWCSKHDVALLPYGVLAGGLLSCNYLDVPAVRSGNRSIQKYLLMVGESGGWEQLQVLLQTLQDIAGRLGTSVSSVAASWVMHRPGVRAIILGTGQRSRIGENSSLACLSLSRQDREAIDGVLSAMPVPAGDVFELERDTGGPHARLMKTNLNAEQAT